MAENWQLIWRYALPKERNVSARSPGVTSDSIVQVFVYDKKTFRESMITALSPATGEERWRQTIDHIANEPVIATDGTIYIASFSGTVHAFAPDGTVLWASKIADSNIGVPLLAGDKLLVSEIAGRSRNTWCLDARTGAVIWQYENGGHSYRLAANDTHLFQASVISGSSFGESTIKLHAISLATGKPLWSVVSDHYLFTPLLHGKHLIIGARASLRAYDLATGDLVARHDIPEDTAITMGPVATEDGLLMADDSGIVRTVALTETGWLRRKSAFTELWNHSFPDTIACPPLRLGDAVYVLTESGQIHRLDAKTGSATAAILALDGDKRQTGGLRPVGDNLAVARGRTVALYRP